MKHHSRMCMLKSRLLVGIFFSLPVLILAGTKLGYIPLSDSRMIDIAAIPALFAVLVGGYAISFPLALLWTIVTFFFEKNVVQDYTFLSLMVINSLYLFSAVWCYRYLEKHLQSSMHILYCVIVFSFSIRTIAMTLPVFSWLGIHQHTTPFDYYTIIALVLQIILSIVVIQLALRHLHDVHLDNLEKGLPHHARQSLPRNL